MERTRVTTGTVWEQQVGYSRALRVGPHVYVSGTLASDSEGNILHAEAPYKQAMAAFEKLERALTELGATRSDVVRVRIYVTSIALEREIGKAHAAFFGETRPCCTMVEISRLASPTASVEIEVEAYAEPK